MRRDDPNLEYLLIVANALGDLRSEVVFVGGSVAGLLLTDPLAEGVRATKDVDAIVEATTLGEYHQVEKQLPELGFINARECRRLCWMAAGIQRVPELVYRIQLPPGI